MRQEPRGVATAKPERAAAKVTARNSTHLTLPFIGRVTLPPRDDLMFLGGLGVLAVAGAVDWPVVAAIGIGHALVHNHHSKALEEFGEALEQA